MSEKCNAEVWVVVDDCGDYAVGKSQEDAAEKYEETIQQLSSASGIRYVQLTVAVPLPVPVVVEVDVPETEDEPVVSVA
jgi:hypothetical protein